MLLAGSPSDSQPDATWNLEPRLCAIKCQLMLASPSLGLELFMRVFTLSENRAEAARNY